MKGFSIIVATDIARGIGKNNQIPWRLSLDMQHFKEVTTASYVPGRSNVVIMGRKTWESLPERFRPLPGRLNVVLTTNASYGIPDGVMKFGSFREAIDFFCGSKEQASFGEVFVIGGAVVYGEAIKDKRCQKIYQTVISKNYNCDTIFPETPDFFNLSSRSERLKEHDVSLRFIELKANHI